MGLDARAQAPRVGAYRGTDPSGLRSGGRAVQPISQFGRVYSAYGGVFIVLALLWGVAVDGFRPDRYDLLGAVVDAVVMVAPARS